MIRISFQCFEDRTKKKIIENFKYDIKIVSSYFKRSLMDIEFKINLIYFLINFFFNLFLKEKENVSKKSF